MKHFSGIYKTALLAGLLLLSQAALPQSLPKGAGDMHCFKSPPAHLTSAPEGDRNIDVVYYAITMDLNYPARRITGSTRVRFTSLSSGLSTIYINLTNSLACDSVVWQNTQIPFTHLSDKVSFTLPAALSLHQVTEVDIYYDGVPASTGFGSFTFGVMYGHPAIWSLSEPFGSSDWWANKNSVDDKADSADIIIICDTSFTAVSNGLLLSKTVTGSKARWHWATRYPIANYLISVAVSNYSLYQNWFRYSATDSLPVVHYLMPEIINDQIPQLDKTIEMMKLFTTLFGEYPFIREKYGHAQFGRGGGMEHQTISSMARFDDGIIAHELAHQWFGDKVTNRTWQDIWLHEGFATYSEGLWYEYLNKDWLKEYMSLRAVPARAAQGTISVQEAGDVFSIFDFNRTYAKSSWVLHMLRRITGDDVFFTILKQFHNSPALAYGNVSTADFEQTASGIYGRSLAYFFDQWINKPGYPKYLVSYSINRSASDRYKTTVTIDQTANTNGVVFRMPLDISVRHSGGDTLLTIDNSSAVQNVEIITSGEPLFVSIDPEEKILKEVNLTRRIPDELLREGVQLYKPWPNPASEKISFGFELIQTKQISAALYSLTGELITEVVNSELSAGVYTFPVNLSQKKISSGIYILRVRAGGRQFHQKISVIK